MVHGSWLKSHGQVGPALGPQGRVGPPLDMNHEPAAMSDEPWMIDELISEWLVYQIMLLINQIMQFMGRFMPFIRRLTSFRPTQVSYHICVYSFPAIIIKSINRMN